MQWHYYLDLIAAVLVEFALPVVDSKSFYPHSVVFAHIVVVVSVLRFDMDLGPTPVLLVAVGNRWCSVQQRQPHPLRCGVVLLFVARHSCRGGPPPRDHF